MSDHELDNLRVEVAFSPDPNTTNATFRDLTSRVRLDRGIEITRGRSEASGQVQTGSCSLTFDNTDGALTPENAGSPYYPNVKPQNRLRVSYRDPLVPGNLLSAEDASFESGSVGSWGNNFFGAPAAVTLANSNTRASNGSRSLRITFPTAAAGCGAWLGVAGLVAGRTYTFQCRVYVPAGVSALRFGNLFGSPPEDQSTTTNAWETLTTTWVATTESVILTIRSASATTSGQQVWVDSIMVDEGATAEAFTTTPSPIRYRFDGYVDEWPVEWPSGGQSESTSAVRAFDLQSRLSRSRPLGSVIEETIRLDSPGWYFPLSEPRESASAGDRITGASIEPTQVNTGGELEFASGTGPPTDSASSPAFRPVDRYNGIFLLGRVPNVDPLGRQRTVVATALTSVARVQCIIEWVDVWGVGLRLGIDATGKAVAQWLNPWNASQERTVTSAQTFSDGRTHTFAATLSDNGSGTSTLRLFVDGDELGSAATFPTAASNYILPVLTQISVGGTANGDLFDGVVAHIAGFGSALNSGDLFEQYQANSGGFAGETTDNRVRRIADWIGLPAFFVSAETGLSAVGHVDPTGKTAWAYMQEVAETEAGILFVDSQGAVRLLNRSNTYDTGASVAVSVDAEDVGPGVRFASGVADVVNDIMVTREGGSTMQVADEASQSEYGVISESIRTIHATDEAALERAHWELAFGARPRVKLPRVSFDGYSEPDHASEVRSLGIWDRVQVSGLPSQAPRSTEDLRVQGYTESISASGWVVTANTSPFLMLNPLIADDPVYGELDADNVAVY